MCMRVEGVGMYRCVDVHRGERCQVTLELDFKWL